MDAKRAAIEVCIALVHSCQEGPLVEEAREAIRLYVQEVREARERKARILAAARKIIGKDL